MEIIGRIYRPHDNSYCINMKNGKHVLIVQKSIMDYNYVGPDKKEEGAEFRIVHNPYVEHVNIYGETFKETFVNVKSLKTGNIYRTLFFENCVL